MATITTINDIPVYSAEIGENEGMICISLVDDPAVQSDFLAFDNDEKPMLFQIQDEAKRRLCGVVMRADYPIYRYSPDKGEFYMVFKPEVIRQMAQKYLADSNQNKVDLMHDGEMITGIEMVQWFIKDSAKGVNPIGFDKIADGSLFCEYQITDDNLWAEVIAGTYKGFSLEGYFGLVPERNEQYTEGIAEEYAGLFNELKQSIKSLTEANMAKMNKIKEMLHNALCELEKFGSKTTDKGILIWDGDEDLKAGDKVYIEQDGERINPEDGEYRTDDKKIIIVANGEVVEIKDEEAEVAPQEEGIADEEAKKKPCKAEGEDAPEEEPAPAPAEEPKDDKYEALIARIDAVEKVNAEILSRLEALEGKPAAEEAHAQYRNMKVQDNDRAVRLALALRR